MKLYLSRLLLNSRERQVQSELARPYQMHRTILRAFPNPLPEDERILFRVDWLAHETLPVLLVQSRYTPCWDALPNSRYLTADLPWGFDTPWEVKPWEPDFRPGQTLRFRLQANPTVKRAGKRHPITRQAGQMVWLERKLEAAGARLLGAERRELGRRVDHKHVEDTSHRITLYGVRFDGLLQTKDPQKLAAAVARGIGSAKGLGFGLLSLALV